MAEEASSPGVAGEESVLGPRPRALREWVCWPGRPREHQGDKGFPQNSHGPAYAKQDGEGQSVNLGTYLKTTETPKAFYFGSEIPLDSFEKKAKWEVFITN